MTAHRERPGGAGAAPPWGLVAGAGAALAVSMGIGRFAYTPILPLMRAQAGLSAGAAPVLATANYLGYLAGALAAIGVPALVRSALAYRASLAVLIASVALMAATTSPAAWFALRLAAGAASALVFMIAVSALLAGLRQHEQHLAGWGFGGVGAGIALSGAVILGVRAAGTAGTWRTAWLASAVLALVLTAGAAGLRPAAAPPAADPAAGPMPAGPGGAPHRWFATLLASYTLEGVGYIIAGTFLVAAISQGSAPWVGVGAWVVVGLAALPAVVLWARLARRWTRPALLLAALLIQAAGIALPALVPGAAAALVSAALFGATFLGIASLALAVGAHLRYPRAVALLTAGYGAGQVLGPLVAAPLLHHGYRPALLAGSVIVAAAAITAATLRISMPGGVRAAVAVAGSPRRPVRAG
jgi:MFS family permease